MEDSTDENVNPLIINNYEIFENYLKLLLTYNNKQDIAFTILKQHKKCEYQKLHCIWHKYNDPIEQTYTSLVSKMDAYNNYKTLDFPLYVSCNINSYGHALNKNNNRSKSKSNIVNMLSLIHI